MKDKISSTVLLNIAIIAVATLVINRGLDVVFSSDISHAKIREDIGKEITAVKDAESQNRIADLQRISVVETAMLQIPIMSGKIDALMLNSGLSPRSVERRFINMATSSQVL